MKSLLNATVLAIVGLLSLQMALAAPARRQPQIISQPDGTTITIVLHGDEFCHWVTDMEGTLLMQDALGCYRPATPAQTAAWELQKAEQLKLRDEVNAARMQRLMARRAASATARRSPEGSVSDMTFDEEEDATPADTVELGNHFGFPNQGQIQGLVVLVEYQDVKFTIEDPLQHYSDMMMKERYDFCRTPTSRYIHYGSAHDYYVENSGGKFDPQFDVYGPICLKNDRKYYGQNKNGNDRCAHEMIIEACEYLDSIGVDFKQYDNDNDGNIDFVFAIYAGQGENAGNVTSDAVWPHAWSVPGVHLYDDVRLQDYACTNELYGNYPDGVGTFCHEFTHVLGLPDVYDVNYVACSPSDYDVLDNGCYNLNGYHPSGLTAYERYELGWLQPTLLKQTGEYSLNDLGESQEAYLVPVTEGIDDPREGEYYLFENRQLTGWDQYIPGHGMLVWHIDFSWNKWYNNTANTWANHQCIDLVEADGKKRSGGEYFQDNTAPFPGAAEHHEFTGQTNPAFAGWTTPGSSSGGLGNNLDLAITDIQEQVADEERPEVSTITFSFMIDASIGKVSSVTADDADAAARIICHEGQMLITTPSGVYDLQGIKLR